MVNRTHCEYHHGLVCGYKFGTKATNLSHDNITTFYYPIFWKLL